MLALAAACACSDQSASSAASSIGPSQATPTRSAALIPGRYIVQFKSTVLSAASAAKAIASSHPGVVDYTYSSAFKGMAMSMSAAEAAALASDPSVLSVEQDQVVTVASVEHGATWGLDRIDQRTLPLNGDFSYASTGSGVTIYFLDSGMDFAHHEFGGRASAGVDILTPGGTAQDCFGHGTEVAAVAGGATFGVAKQAKLVAVRVVGCTGGSTTSILIAGVDWVTAHRVLPAVANMSVSTGYSAALNQAIATSIASGVQYAIGAGNSADDACNHSPSSVLNGIVVGATASNDGLASFSNFGACVTLNAPGNNIPTASYHGDTSTTIMTGTSASAPFVAGAAALYLQANPGMSPAVLKSTLIANATPNVLSRVPAGTPNRLLYVGNLTSAPPPPPPPPPTTNRPPAASISSPVRGATFARGASVAFAGSATDPEDGVLTGAALTWTSSRDGAIGSGASFATSALSVGTHTITLTASDRQHATSTATTTVTITAVSSNQPPVARFTFSCAAAGTHQCTFDAGTSSDDVGVASYGWSWGNGRSESHPTSSAKNTWSASGSANVTLTVTDGGGLTSTLTRVVTIP